ncbi:regulatory-associated protein of TOR 2-like isoform X2 [Chenopodium quinoa]|uniref:regulatory-associated protein of TOR 2-like isoform X2 n=1 Tax=Chenopodium quinoa TaxID=63459 RepID=UPI000B7874E8|nr:regulatory-associated protein of TOR 2-like isoform X2 [Chenopodium quinoa]
MDLYSMRSAPWSSTPLAEVGLYRCRAEEVSDTASVSGGGGTMYFPPSIEFYEDSVPSESGFVSKWRLKDRTMTEMAALVLCLNINCDPPDVIKISPCARLECWIDPLAVPRQKALEAIGMALKLQYKRWQPKAQYKYQLDPTVEEVKRLCNTYRSFAKKKRILFHYNGHGVPKPTSDGVMWLLNRSYTQYIPLRATELDSWLKSPSIYVFDCSAAGNIVNAFIELIDASISSGAAKDCILLAACEAHETLPQSAEFPADVFTSCLTTPLQMALRWLCKRSLLHESLDHSLIDNIPGHLSDRKTLLGELNWIFTAVTDTIAWNVLPRDLFQRLFRQDQLVASLFRNFLLAERIMRSANCSPFSYPMLPPTHQHHMWDAWDMAAEICLSQLPSLIHDPTVEFQPSPFFTEQLTAVEVWLDHGSEQKKPPEQLAIVLQALFSQCHRFRALELLARFLDMGPWAVDLALSVGNLPTLLKLLPTAAPELQQTLVFIWSKILAHDKSCQVDLVKVGGHTYFIRFLDSLKAFPEQRAMAAFVLAVIVDGHKEGQEACIEAGLLDVCLKHFQDSTPNNAQSEHLFLQWLCLCLGKMWEGFTEAQLLGLQAGAAVISASLLSKPQSEVRASAVFVLGTFLGVGFDSSRYGGDECDDDEKLKAEITIIRNLLSVVSDGSPLVRAEVAVALARFAFGHNKHLKSVAAMYGKSQPNTGVSTPGSIITSQIGMLRIGGDSTLIVRDGRVSTSNPLATTGIMHGSPLLDDSSQYSDSGASNDGVGNGIMNHVRPRPLDTSVYLDCILSMCTLAKDPSPRIARLGRRVLSIIGIEQVARPNMPSTSNARPSEPITSAAVRLSGLARSSSWFDMNSGHFPLTFRTPPISIPRASCLTRIRRVSSSEFRPHLLNSPDLGLADPLGYGGSDANTECSLLPRSNIYNWSCGHFSKPLLTPPDDAEELLAKREAKERSTLDLIVKCQNYFSKLYNQIASWDTKFENGTKTTLLQPFSPVVIAADEKEQIRVWNYEEPALLNTFDNHEFPDSGISKLCLLNELDSLLLVASGDGNVRIWKDYMEMGKQKLVTAFSSLPVHGPTVCNLNANVDWQQQSGYLFVAGDVPSIKVWDLDKEQLLHSIPSSPDNSISALAASQVHGGQFAAGFADGSVRIFDIRTPEMLVCAARPHIQRIERVVGIDFQPGLDVGKIVSASQAGDIQFLDIRNHSDAYLTINAHRGTLTALAVHRHAPIIASASAKQLIKIFSLEGEQLGTIRCHPTFMAQRSGSISCLTFHPYQVLLAAGAANPFVSLYAADNNPTR